MKVTSLGLGQDEVIQAEIRRHWFHFLASILPIVLLSVPPFVLGRLMIDFMPHLASTFFPLFLFAASLYFLALFGFFMFRLVDYYLDTWVITNKRIFRIEQKGLFRRSLTELRMERIQDMTVTVHGFVQTFYNFGDVLVQTASEEGVLVFDDVPNPKQVQEHIADLQRGVLSKKI